MSEREGDELVDLALHWGLSIETVHRLHEAYLRHLVAVALADGTVTPTKQRDLQQVARLLRIGEARLEQIVSGARDRLGTRTPAVVPSSAETPSWQGQRVCFTGTLRSRRNSRALSYLAYPIQHVLPGLAALLPRDEAPSTSPV